MSTLVRALSIVTIVVLTSTTVGCLQPTPLPGPPPKMRAVDFDYFGKISLGKPTFNQNTVRLPITFEGGEWANARGVDISEVHAVTTDRQIYITALVVEHGNVEQKVSNTQGLLLTGIRQGIYDVYYQNREGALEDSLHKVGRTVIKKSLPPVPGG